MAASIASAAATSLRTIRITFNAACADESAIDPEVWVFARETADGPYYVPTPVSVVGVDSSTTPTIVDITGDQEFTPGVLYRVTTPGGITGIVINGSANVKLFWGIAPVAPTERDYSIIDMIPSVNQQEDSTGDLQKFVACLQEVANLLWNDVDRWGDIYDLDRAIEQYLDLMLKQLGSPVELPDLTVSEKRKLVQLLVSIYRQKGSVPGLRAAIRFFVGLQSQITTFYGFGFVLGDGILAHGDYPGAGGGDPGTWVLGDGTPWSFTVKCGTATGVGLDASQIARVTEIVTKFKVGITVLRYLSASWNAPARADIKDNGAGSVTIRCSAVSGATVFKTFWRTSANVNEWNGTALAMVSRAVTLTPGETRYWKACADNTVTGVPGLLSNEVTNALTTPVLTVASQVRNLHLSWPAVAGATSYRIYKSVAAAVRPTAADNASTPIRVSDNSYDDALESGVTFYYIVVPMIGDAEGFYSNEASGTTT